MSDENTEGKGKIPAGPLKSDDNIERDITYYYSREHRLSRASEEVRAMNDGKTMRPSLTRTLLATKGHKLVFFTIVLFFAVSALVSRFTSRGNDVGVKLGGNTVALTLVAEGGVLVLGIVKEVPKTGEFYLGAVDLAVSPVATRQNEGEARAGVFSHRIFFNPLETEVFHVVLPFEGADFIVVLQTNEEMKSLRLRAGR